jgi:hypothetical protein
MLTPWRISYQPCPQHDRKTRQTQVYKLHRIGRLLHINRRNIKQYIPEDSELYTRRRENFKSHTRNITRGNVYVYRKLPKQQFC